MSFTLGGIPIIRGEIHHPSRGTLCGDLEIAAPDQALTGLQTLSLPGFDQVATVTLGGISEMRQKVRVTGGAGGLSKIIPGQHFNQTTPRDVLRFIMLKSGEQLAADSDAAVLDQRLPHWQIISGTAAQALDRLVDHLGSTWWVTAGGKVHIGDPAWESIEPDHVLLHEDLVAGALTISSTEDTVRPGTTFRGQRVTSVEHTLVDDRCRSIVRTGSARHPFDEAMKNLIEHFAPASLPAYEAKVTTQNADGTLDLEPANPEVGPGWKNVEIALQGLWSVKVQPGARCILEFLDNDRTKPIVRQFIKATFTEAVMDSGEAAARKEDPVEVKVWLLVGPIGTSGGVAVVGVSPVLVAPTPPAITSVVPVTLSMGKITGGSSVVKKVA